MPSNPGCCRGFCGDSGCRHFALQAEPQFSAEKFRVFTEAKERANERGTVSFYLLRTQHTPCPHSQEGELHSQNLFLLIAIQEKGKLINGKNQTTHI